MNRYDLLEYKPGFALDLGIFIPRVGFYFIEPPCRP